MTKKGLRKTREEREAKKHTNIAGKILIGTAAVTTASAMVAAIYAACRALEKEKDKNSGEAEEAAL